MLSYLLRQAINGVLTLFLIVTLTFFLLRLLPGGPFDQERKLPPAVQANMEARFHLNRSLPEQYVTYMAGLLRGDLGPSYKYLTRSVNDIVWESAGVSLQLGAWAVLIGVAIGTFTGMVAGGTRLRWLDQLLSVLGVSAISLPSFIFGACLILIFAYDLGWFPAARLASQRHAVLPIATLSLVPFAYSFLLIRSAMKTVMTQSFIHVKSAYGLSYQTIVNKHALKNALIPLISILGPLTAALVTGSFAVELIYALPGLGKHFIYAVSNRDYTLVMGITLVYSVFLIAFNTLTDLLYGVVNPKLRVY